MELTHLLEQVSGSDEYKEEYDRLEREKKKAEDDSIYSYQKKKGLAQERTSMRKQKEEVRGRARARGARWPAAREAARRGACRSAAARPSARRAGSRTLARLLSRASGAACASRRPRSLAPP